MLLKKFALIGSALVISALPVIANADLVTCNFTREPSTVRITSSPLPVKPCSSAFKDGITPPGYPGGVCLPGKPPMIVKSICGATKGACIADVYASADCTGTKVGTVSIDLANLNVTVISQHSDYNIVPKGSTVEIHYSH